MLRIRFHVGGVFLQVSLARLSQAVGNHAGRQLISGFTRPGWLAWGGGWSYPLLKIKQTQYTSRCHRQHTFYEKKKEGYTEIMAVAQTMLWLLAVGCLHNGAALADDARQRRQINFNEDTSQRKPTLQVWSKFKTLTY
jgi:hypothetical protein